MDFEMGAPPEGLVEPELLKQQRKKTAFKDSLVLGPIDKYVKYGRFPWKFVVHIVLMALTAWQVLLQIVPQG